MSERAPVEPLWGYAEVAEFLGVSIETVKHWRKHRRGPLGFRVGRHVRFDPADIRTWLRQRRET